MLAIIIISFVFWLIEKKEFMIFYNKNLFISSTLGVIIGSLWLGLAVGIICFSRMLKFTGKKSVD